MSVDLIRKQVISDSGPLGKSLGSIENKPKEKGSKEKKRQARTKKTHIDTLSLSH